MRKMKSKAYPNAETESIEKRTKVTRIQSKYTNRKCSSFLRENNSIEGFLGVKCQANAIQVCVQRR